VWESAVRTGLLLGVVFSALVVPHDLAGIEVGQGSFDWRKETFFFMLHAHTQTDTCECEQEIFFFQTQPHWGSKERDQGQDGLFVFVLCYLLVFPIQPATSLVARTVINPLSFLGDVFLSAKILVAGEPNVSYICSRYYRAPELIFGATNYTTNIGKGPAIHTHTHTHTHTHNTRILSHTCPCTAHPFFPLARVNAHSVFASLTASLNGRVRCLVNGMCDGRVDAGAASLPW